MRKVHNFITNNGAYLKSARAAVGIEGGKMPAYCYARYSIMQFPHNWGNMNNLSPAAK